MDRTTETEDLLRAALQERAEVVDPADRLEDVLAATGPASRVRWWMPAGAAAAAVAAVVAGVWLVRGPLPDPSPTLPAVTATTAPAPTPSATQSLPSPSPTPSGSGAPARAVLPVYVVAAEVPGAPARGYGLARRWLTLDAGEDPAGRVRAAVDASFDAPVEGTDPAPWAGVDVRSVTIAADGLTVEVSGPPRSTGTAVDDLALPQVGWTAQAVLGEGNLPVTVTSAGATLGVVTRPASDTWYAVLTDVWITAPTPGASLPAASAVTVRGQASVFEAALVWQLERSGAVVGTGQATASAGAPARGDYAIDLGVLTAGEYTVRVRSLSPKDGSVDGEDVVTFSVR